MKYDVLKRSHFKTNIVIGVIAVLILSALILTFTRAKYRITESIPLVSGTISFSPYDFNVVAMYLNKNGESIKTNKVPHVGYTLNNEQSTCIVDDKKDENAQIVYENSYLYFNQVSWSGTKCSVYFDLIPDDESPTIKGINSKSDDTSITVTVNATDNIGIYNYYFQLDDEEVIRSEEATYKFEGLSKGQTYTLKVRVEDAVGNFDETNKEVTAGLRTADVILANEGGLDSIKSKGVPNFSNIVTTDEGMYAAEDDYGTSYYYRGAVDDNWFQFAGYYWRIIRINGDGSVRMIYQGTSVNETGTGTQIGTGVFNNLDNDNMYVGFRYTESEVHGLNEKSAILNYLDAWYESNLINNENYLDLNIGFCNDRQPSTNYSESDNNGGTGTINTFYAPRIRLEINKTPTYKCNDYRDIFTDNSSINGNKMLDHPIGLITADEVTFAGGVYSKENNKYYLYTGQSYWTMSPSTFDYNYAQVFNVAAEGYLQSIFDAGVNYTHGIRPVINISADIQLIGIGTSTDPYRIAE